MLEDTDLKKKFDLFLEWKEEQELACAKAQGKDMFQSSVPETGDIKIYEPVEKEEPLELNEETGEALISESEGNNYENTGFSNDGPDKFEFSEDRQKAIEEALSQFHALALPPVHSQLLKIYQALEENKLEPGYGKKLLKEIENYLIKKIACINSRQEIAMPTVMLARKQALGALENYLNSADFLQKYLEENDQTNLHVAIMLIQQAYQILMESKETLLASRPF
ncbi:MAG: hypothetical protein ACLFQV_08140 [Vulcanimicrobiota bacterium]